MSQGDSWEAKVMDRRAAHTLSGTQTVVCGLMLQNVVCVNMHILTDASDCWQLIIPGKNTASCWCFLICFFFFFLPAGSVCYPACVVALDMDLRDPVVLPNGTSADSLKHWMLPTKVQVGVHWVTSACVVTHWVQCEFCCTQSNPK